MQEELDAFHAEPDIQSLCRETVVNQKMYLFEIIETRDRGTGLDVQRIIPGADLFAKLTLSLTGTTGRSAPLRCELNLLCRLTRLRVCLAGSAWLGE